MDYKFDRRSFLKGAATCSLAATGLNLIGGMDPLGIMKQAWAAGGARPVVAVARDGAPEAMARAAVAALGGMGRFVKKGEVVVVKPNIGWDRTVEQAANTNPEVVKAVVRMCLEAGAKQVRVLDRTCNDPRRCYKKSGIKDAVESINDPAATVEHMDDRKFVAMPVKDGAALQSWTFYKDILDADKVINVPIAKHHNAARLTMSLKNIMGVLGGNRGNIHHDLDANIAALNTVMKFDLIVLDAVRILTANGPQGGRLQDVKVMNTVAAGTDPVAVDSYGATLFGITGRDVPHVLHAYHRGLGEIDLGKVKVISA
ncbi:MAG TPA: DUF362 domain-containing protein [Nitrospirota bacterium]|nr:DUF362 domain-containing protein [Nitrospirota bacterium]